MKTLGERIRERREELDLSLREFAKQLDCSPPFISDIEHGRRFPSGQTLELMAQVLKVKVKELQELDPRAPIEEMKKMAEKDPAYAFAFRTITDRRPSAKALLEAVTAMPKNSRSVKK